MIVCNRCDYELKHGDHYKIAYDMVWCEDCADIADAFGDFGMTYVRENFNYFKPRLTIGVARWRKRSHY